MMVKILALVIFMPLTVLSKCHKADAAGTLVQCDPVEQCGSFTSYSALGDSYAVGLGSAIRLKICQNGEGSGSNTCTSEQCKKDVGAYSHQYAYVNNITNFQYLSCSGANVSTILDTQVDVPDFGKPDLVTVNAGGDDDRAFSEVILYCVYERFRGLCPAAIQNAQSALKLLPDRLDALFSGITENAAPSATVVVLGYPRIWGTTDVCPWPEIDVPAEDRLAINDLVVAANTVLMDTALQAGFKYADVDAAYESHRVCDSSNPWFQLNLLKCGLDTSAHFYCEESAFHPTLEGQDAYLSVLNTALGC